MKNILIIIFLIILFSCKKENRKNANNNEEINKKQTSNIKIDKNLLSGVWAENEDENAIFEIKGDTLRYVEFYGTPYFYKLVGDSIKIYLENEYVSGSKILKISQDSLVLKSDDGDIIRLYRR